MTPFSGTTYYLKEVDNRYLKPSIYKIYRSDSKPHVIRDLYLMTAVDDEIKIAGFVIDGEPTQVGLEESIRVNKTNKDGSTSSTSIVATQLTGADTLTGKAAHLQISDYIDKTSGSITVRAFYVTEDKVKVTGSRENTFEFTAENALGQDWLTKESLKSNPLLDKPIYEVTDAYRARSARKTFTINASKALSYTVTKVDNGKKVAQSVNGGDYTGKITYSGKTNYVFAGWYEDAAYTKAADFSNVKGDMTVYAKYVKASDVKLSFTKKSVKSGNVTLKATLKINNQPDAADAAVECSYNDKAYAVEFTGVKTSKSVNTYTGAVTIDGLANGSAFAAVISYKTPDGTIVSLGSKTCKYNAGLVTVK
jgi:uncharacterized repeat protein (TIGR02543 family)